jgi:ABC-2 type transport system permease protein
MSAVLALALKDLKLLVRVRSALFFTVGWPLLVAIFFGLLFGGQNRSTPPLRIAVADDDGTPESKAFGDALATKQGFDVVRVPRAEAVDLVRRGQRVAAVGLSRGFGEASGRMFYGAPPVVDLLIDPSRQAETAMLQGLLVEQASRRMQTMLASPAESRRMIAGSMQDAASAPSEEAGRLRRFLTELDTFLEAQPATTDGNRPAWQPLEVRVQSIARERTGPRSGFDVTFPQGMMWGIIGCMMSFAVSIAVERSQGTLTRLRMSPVPAWTLLAGKALACWITILVVQALLLAVGVTIFGLRVGSPALFAIAALVAPAAFVGLMMLVASFGENEQAASGAGWALMMPLAMLGGAMVPLIVMPAWMVSASHLSPIKWAILAYEGAIWRGFTAADIFLPVAILLTVGAVAFALGAYRFRSLT